MFWTSNAISSKICIEKKNPFRVSASLGKKEFIQRVRTSIYCFSVIFLGRKMINRKNLFHMFWYCSSLSEEGRAISTSGN